MCAQFDIIHQLPPTAEFDSNFQVSSVGVDIVQVPRARVFPVFDNRSGFNAA